MNNEYTSKVTAFNSAILAYEDALSDYRRARILYSEGEMSEQSLEETKEEVVAAHYRFEQAEHALNN